MFIHAEVKGGGSWGQYKSQMEADALRDSQHPRGKRGAALRKRLGQASAFVFGFRLVLPPCPIMSYPIFWSCKLGCCS